MTQFEKAAIAKFSANKNTKFVEKHEAGFYRYACPLKMGAIGTTIRNTNTLSKEFAILPGVTGSCISVRNEGILFSSLPDSFTDVMVEEAANNIGRMMQMAKANQGYVKKDFPCTGQQAFLILSAPLPDMVYNKCLERWTANNPPDVSRFFELIGCIPGEIDNRELFDEFKEKITALLCPPPAQKTLSCIILLLSQKIPHMILAIPKRVV